ncbi:MAG: hypothetical protein AB7F43_05350 [Bacteriovoracia bacterium]
MKSKWFLTFLFVFLPIYFCVASDQKQDSKRYLPVCITQLMPVEDKFLYDLLASAVERQKKNPKDPIIDAVLNQVFLSISQRIENLDLEIEDGVQKTVQIPFFEERKDRWNAIHLLVLSTPSLQELLPSSFEANRAKWALLWLSRNSTWALSNDFRSIHDVSLADLVPQEMFEARYQALPHFSSKKDCDSQLILDFQAYLNRIPDGFYGDIDLAFIRDSISQWVDRIAQKR